MPPAEIRADDDRPDEPYASNVAVPATLEGRTVVRRAYAKRRSSSAPAAASRAANAASPQCESAGIAGA